MPNGNGTSGPGNAIVNAVLGHVTRMGIVGGSLYIASQLALAVIHHSWEQALSATGYIGLLMAVGGAAFSAKKAGEVMVATVAEQRIHDPNLPTSSNIPALNREIAKQLAGTSRETGG